MSVIADSHRANEGLELNVSLFLGFSQPFDCRSQVINAFFRSNKHLHAGPHELSNSRNFAIMLIDALFEGQVMISPAGQIRHFQDIA